MPKTSQDLSPNASPELPVLTCDMTCSECANTPELAKLDKIINGIVGNILTMQVQRRRNGSVWLRIACVACDSVLFTGPPDSLEQTMRQRFDDEDIHYYEQD